MPETSLILAGGGLSPPSSLTAIAFSGIGGQTLRAYRSDWAHLAREMGVPDAEAAARYLVDRGQGEATRIALAYRQRMIDNGDAPASINRRLCSLRFMFISLRRCGRIGWTLEVPGVKVQNMRDTRGPRDETYEKMLESVKRKPDRVLLLRLLRDMALRRREVADLTLADVIIDGEGMRLCVKGKGKLEKLKLKVPPVVASALKDWLSARGGEPGSLLRMSYQKIERVVNRAGWDAGATVTPHGLRHSGITRAAAVTNGNAPAVQKFARHQNISTTMRYIDDFEDTYGKIAEMVSGDNVRGEGK